MSNRRGRDIFYKFKKLLCLGSSIYSLFPRLVRLSILKSIGDKKGTLRIAQRYMLLRTLAKSVGDNVSIHDHVNLHSIENMTIGSNVSIHPMCYIQASGGLTIGNDVSIAHGVTIMTEEHSYSDTELPIKDQPIQHGAIYIEDNVWIGAKATILSGITLKNRSIIAAGAVVTKTFSEGVILAGVPAKIIKYIK